MKKQIQNKNEGAAVAGLAALAAAAAGVYFLYGSKDATKKRKAVKSWSLKMKAEVLENIEKLKDIDQKVYQDIVEKVSKKYQALKGIEMTEVDAVSKELASHWKAIKNSIMPQVKPAQKLVKKVVVAAKKDIKKIQKNVAKVVNKSPKKIVKKTK